MPLSPTERPGSLTSGRVAPKVSAIICVLDGEAFLDEAIRSVVGQHGFADWELLIVDDGSTDASPLIAKRWAARDSRISCLEHPGHENQGGSASRNLGVAAARGDYVAFLDADDVWLPEKLAYQVSVLDDHPGVDVTYGPSLWWWSWSGEPGTRHLDHLVPLGIEPGTVLRPPELFREIMSRNGAGVPTMGSLLLRRRALEAVGGFEASFRGAYDDQTLYAKMGLHMTALVTGRCVDLYRQHDASTCARDQAAGTWHPYLLSPAEETYLKWLVGYLVETGHGDEPSVAEIQATLRLYRSWRGPWVLGNARWRLSARARLRATVLERVPPTALGLFKRWLRPRRPIDLGALDRVTPTHASVIATPDTTVDERWEHQFLGRHRALVTGRVLVIGSSLRLPHLHGPTTEWLPSLGQPDPDTREPAPTTTGATGAGGPNSPGDPTRTTPPLECEAYDCIVACDVLQGATDPAALLAALADALVPGGHLLLTTPALIQRREDDRAHPRWGFSADTVEDLLAHAFEGPVEVEARGNALAAVAVLHGLPASRFDSEDLDADDPSIQVLITARATRR